MTKAEQSKGEHQNVARAAQVIEVLARAKETGLRLTDVIEATGLGTATIHRLLTGLVAHGFVDQDPTTNRYFVGLRMVSWAAVATERYGLFPFVDDVLHALSVETEDMVYFSLISGVESICVDRREGSYPIKTLTLSVGDRRPLGVGAGSMALLANQTDEFVQSTLANNQEMRARYRLSEEFIRASIATTRREGYAVVPGKLIPGMSGVAVAVRRPNGHAVAAISIAAITQRLSGARLEKVATSLKAYARQVEEKAAKVLATPFATRHASRKGN